jgi:AMMECR1 domain-containing protein
LNREQFLAETCVKAGLSREAWREPGTRLFGFECEIISAAEEQARQK